MRLQRVLADFGADDSFEMATKKVHEHYGIDVPKSTTRLKVEKHAEKMRTMNEDNAFKSTEKKVDCLIGEADGGMVPLVATQQAAATSDVKIDRRKNKRLFWKEGILAFARGHKRIQSYFFASMGSREEAGKNLAKCTDLAGRHEKSRLHCLGDGAPWIAEQVEGQFGSDATFLIDFYHLTQYLVGAALCIQANDSMNSSHNTLVGDPLKKSAADLEKLNPVGLKWLETQKKLILDGQIEKVFQTLQEHIETMGPDHKECPVQKCFNYMDKRRKYLNYKDALAAELPIGSGEIESGVRSVIQSRLKIPGAWWLADNANAMLALKTVRVNGFWEQYWRQQRTANQEFSA